MLKSDLLLQNRYRVVAVLGEGGMGTVYRAWDTRLNVYVALKEMIPQSDLDSAALEQLYQQFHQEATVLARLDHSNLVGVTDFFEENKHAYLVMKFVDGESLADYIQREKMISEVQVLTWAEQLLDALSYCHAQGVIHRDIKPQNVIIRSNGQAVLVDFGLAKLWDVNDSRTKTVMRGIGTPEYAPPEQYDIAMGHTDPRSDLYSLGATLYHALAGQAPPTATSRISDPDCFDKAWVGVKKVTSKTQSAIAKSLELARAQRWPSATAMGEALGLKVACWEQNDEEIEYLAISRGGTRKMDGNIAAVPLLPSSKKRRLSVWAWIAGGAVFIGLLAGFMVSNGVFSQMIKFRYPLQRSTATVMIPTVTLKPSVLSVVTLSPNSVQAFTSTPFLSESSEKSMGGQTSTSTPKATQTTHSAIAATPTLSYLVTLEPSPTIASATSTLNPETLTVTLTPIASGAAPIPTSTPLPTVLPTATFTSVPIVDEPTALSSPTQPSTTPTVQDIPSGAFIPSPPQLMLPVNDKTVDENPIIFQWMGLLGPGQSYVVHARNSEPGHSYVFDSPPLSASQWGINAPGEAFGEWKWEVRVVQDGAVLVTSSEGKFWFDLSPD